MDIEKDCNESLARVSAWVDGEAAYQKRLISFNFKHAMSELEARHGQMFGFIGMSDLMGWKNGITLRGPQPTCSEFRAPGNVLLYRDNPIYINVPAILAIWLRSTTPYRLARRIWVGERG